MTRLERSKDSFNEQAKTATALTALKRKMTATLKKRALKQKAMAQLLLRTLARQASHEFTGYLDLRS